MAISFNNIPDTIRTPGSYAEVDNSRALQGLAQNPHKALIIGQKTSGGLSPVEVIKQITSDKFDYIIDMEITQDYQTLYILDKNGMVYEIALKL